MVSQMQPLSTSNSFNPYRAEPGPKLDEHIHQRLFPTNAATIPSYSTDKAASAKIAQQLQRKFGRKVVTGATRTRPVRYFARLDSDPSTAVEALADSAPLAICRLAAVVLRDR
jgi:hypothetical protein